MNANVQAEKYFNPLIIQKANRLLKLGKVSLSFQKGSLDGFLIATGIVKDNSTFESKVVYKKRLEGTEEGPLSTNCTCTEWTEEKHCAHTTAIFLYIQSVESKGTDELAPLIGGHGVTPREYGTIINGPHELENSGHIPTYSALKYTLSTKKTIDFPIPKNFNGRLLVNIKPNKEFSLGMQDDVKNSVRYAYEDQEGNIQHKISVFESLYLFNWATGEVLFLPAELKELISIIRTNLSTITIDNILNLCVDPKIKDMTSFLIQGQDATENIEEPNLRIFIENSDRKGFNNFSIEFFNQDEKRCKPPIFLRLISFTGGGLDIFKKKADAYEFLNQILDHFEIESDTFKKSLSGKSKKNQWIRACADIHNNNFSLTYDIENNKIYKYDNKLISLLFKSFVLDFGPQFFRYSYFYTDTNELIMQVSMSTIVQGLSKFYAMANTFGVSVFYNQAQLNQWSSRIRFERDKIGRSGWFDLELAIDDEDLEVLKNADFENNIAITKSGVVLLDNNQKDLLKFVKKYTQIEKKEEINEGRFKKFVIPFNRARIFELFELKKIGLEGHLTEEELALCHKLQNLEEMPQYSMPENYKTILRPYQKTGYNWLRFLHESKLGACLADDMGLGKTLQTICFINSIYDQIESALIVCPVSILLNWENEFKKFSDIDVHIFHGANREMDPTKKITLTSYGILKRELDSHFTDKKFDLFILDEVQHLKNMRSLGAYAARKINADFRICLTGTPVENDLAEFYNIIDLSIPGIWGDLKFLRSTSTPKSRVFARKTASPFILRRTKNQVLTDLPPKIENNVVLSLSDSERGFYTDKLKSIKSKIMAAPKRKKYGEILKGLLELRQSCLWQDHDNTSKRHFKHIESSKVNFLLENLEQILEEGHQAIIFSQFTTYLDIIQTAFNEKTWKYSRIDGSLNVKKRQSEVDKFQNGDNQLFLISLKAGGVGLNLTAASYVFIMDPWWNPAVESQAIDRAYRIGQKNKLTVYRPIIKDSVEEKVLKLQELKRELFKDLLPEDDESNVFSGKLTMKDFEELFN